MLAIAVASSALGGGSSLSKLTKQIKQLKLQVANVSKQQGPPGPPGAQGVQGPGATKLDYDVVETNGALADLGTQNELTVATQCSRDAGAAQIAVYVRSSVAGVLNYTRSIDVDGGPVDLANGGLAVTTSDSEVVFAGGGGGVSRVLMQGTYRNDSRVISVQLTAIADDVAGRCKVQGTLIPAS